MTGDQRQPRLAAVGEHADVSPIDDRDAVDAIEPARAVRALDPQLVAAAQVGEKGHVRVAMPADRGVALGAGERGAGDVPGAEGERPPRAAGENHALDAETRRGQPRHRVRVRPRPRPRRLAARHAALPGALEQHLRQLRFGVDPPRLAAAAERGEQQRRDDQRPASHRAPPLLRGARAASSEPTASSSASSR